MHRILLIFICAIVSARAEPPHHQEADAPPSATSQTSQPVPTSAVFEKCDKTTDYLEIPLANLIKANAGLAGQPPEALESCINSAQRENLPKDSYFMCQKGRNNTVKEVSATRPCASKAMADVTSLQLMQTAACFDIPMRTVLPMVLRESKAQPHSRNPTGAAGLMALTGTAIDDVNDRIAKKADGGVPSQNENCQQLRDGIKKSSLSSSIRACSRVAFPVEPPWNTVYGFALLSDYQERMKETVEEAFADWPKNVRRPTAEEIKEAGRIFSIFSYNGGQGIIASHAVSFIEKIMAKRKPLNIETLADDFKAYLLEHFKTEKELRNEKKVANSRRKLTDAEKKRIAKDKKAGEARRKEVSNYFENVMESFSHFDTLSGGSCNKYLSSL